jgi:hypothetical protein
MKDTLALRRQLLPTNLLGDMPMPTNELIQQLDRQLHYIETSAHQYDSGNMDEVIRIGAALRTIFHEDANCTSLLTRLNAGNIQLLSTSSLNSPHVGYCNNLTKTMLNPFTLDMWAEPWLAESKSSRQVPYRAWWSEEIMFSNGPNVVRRRDIILWATDHDSGDQVDATPDVNYERLKNGMDMTWTLTQPDKSKHILRCRNLHLASLRQFGYEALNSPELLRIAGR